MREAVLKQRVLPTVSLDIVMLALVYFIPTLSHITEIPFSILEPFRLMVLVSLIVLNDRNNSIVLSLTLPLFSFLVAGHPLFAKMFIISAELIINVVLYCLLKRRINNQFILVFVSILLSKVAYYSVKYLFVATGILSTSVVSTSITIQVLVAIATSIIFGYIAKKKGELYE